MLTLIKITPINHHHDSIVNKNSFDLVQDHLNSLRSSRILMQVCRTR